MTSTWRDNYKVHPAADALTEMQIAIMRRVAGGMRYPAHATLTIAETFALSDLILDGLISCMPYGLTARGWEALGHE